MDDYIVLAWESLIRYATRVPCHLEMFSENLFCVVIMRLFSEIHPIENANLYIKY